MKAIAFAIVVLACAVATRSATAQTILRVDFNLRGTESDTQAGFTSFVINSVGTAALTQTGTVSRVIGSYTVSVAGSGSNPGYVDRHRTTPTDGGALTQSALYRDFVFSSDTGTGGLNVTVDGLTPNESYQVTLWSFDSGSTSGGIRYSDWTANGILQRSGYNFTGTALPANDSQNQIIFKVAANATGQIVIQGRRNASTAANQVAVFLNALQIDGSTPDAPSNAVVTGTSDIYAGDNAIFNATSGGTAPFTFHWLKDGAPLGIVTSNGTFVLSNAQLASIGNYSAIASNLSGSTTSSVAALNVRTVQNITSGLLAYWPLDNLITATADVSGNDNSLLATNMDGSNVLPSARGNAFSFNGVDEHLVEQNLTGASLPASTYPAYSVAFWVKGDGTNQLDKRVFAESSSTNNNTLFSLGTGNPAGTNGLDVFIRFNNAGNPVSHRRTSLPVFDNTWHHVVWVDNNGFGTVYVDGIADTNNFNYARGVITPNIANIGAVYRDTAVPAVTAFFAGLVDDVAVWRRALSSNEVRSVMTFGPNMIWPIFTGVSLASSNVTLRYVDPAGTFNYAIDDTDKIQRSTIDFTGDPQPPTVWNEVTNAIVTVTDNVATVLIPQPAGSTNRFYRLRSR